MMSRGSGTGTPHGAGYLTFGAGQVSRDILQQGMEFAFVANAK